MTERCCNHCGVGLTADTWAVGNVRKNNYICRVCDGIKGKRNRLRRLAASLGQTTLRNYSKVKDGYVYAIVNPAWPDWVKIGMAIDVDDRCNGYQTSSPFRDYEILYSCYVSDRRKAERASHKRAEKLALERSGEWFKIDHDLVREAIKGAVEKYSITALLK